MFRSVLNSLSGADHNTANTNTNNTNNNNRTKFAGDRLSLNSSEGALSGATSGEARSKDMGYARLSIKNGKRRLSSMMNRLRVSSPSSGRRASGSKPPNNNESDGDERDDYDDLELEANECKPAEGAARRLSSSNNGPKKGRSRRESCSSSTTMAMATGKIVAESSGSSYGKLGAANDDTDQKYILPEEQCDIPTFLHTKNCDSYLIDETRRLLKERYAKNSDSFYDADYRRMLTDDWTVSRFLLRRRLDPKRTAKLMEECGRFRKQYKMSEVQLWEFPIEFHKAGGLFKYAPDRVGNATMYMRVRMYRRVPEISDVFKAFILCVLEQCDVANNGRGTAVVFDLTGCGLQNVDLGFLSWLLSSFRNYCPKGVSYILVYNLPWILNATCKLAMTWMSASNKRALRFVYGDEIENFIERANLPDYLGGECKLNYRAIPAGSRPAIEVCDRLDMTREQAIKIRELFKEYLTDDDDGDNNDGYKAGHSERSECGDTPIGSKLSSSNYDEVQLVDADHLANRNGTSAPPTDRHVPVVDLVSQASKFISH